MRSSVFGPYSLEMEYSWLEEWRIARYTRPSISTRSSLIKKGSPKCGNMISGRVCFKCVPRVTRIRSTIVCRLRRGMPKDGKRYSATKGYAVSTAASCETVPHRVKRAVPCRRQKSALEPECWAGSCLVRIQLHAIRIHTEVRLLLRAH